MLESGFRVFTSTCFGLLVSWFGELVCSCLKLVEWGLAFCLCACGFVCACYF